MAPKNNFNEAPKNQSTSKEENAIEADIKEIEEVSNSLDSLNDVLDVLEKKSDEIKERLQKLLDSNHEIRLSFMNENSVPDNGKYH